MATWKPYTLTWGNDGGPGPVNLVVICRFGSGELRSQALRPGSKFMW